MAPYERASRLVLKKGCLLISVMIAIISKGALIQHCSAGNLVSLEGKRTLGKYSNEERRLMRCANYRNSYEIIMKFYKNKCFFRADSIFPLIKNKKDIIQDNWHSSILYWIKDQENINNKAGKHRRNKISSICVAGESENRLDFYKSAPSYHFLVFLPSPNAFWSEIIWTWVREFPQVSSAKTRMEKAPLDRKRRKLPTFF